MTQRALWAPSPLWGLGLTIEDLRAAEAGILSTLQGSRKTAVTVISDLARQGIREDAVRSAIWELIDRGEVELTADRRLQVRNSH